MKLILFYNKNLGLFVFSIYSEPRETDESLNGTCKTKKQRYYGTEKCMSSFLWLENQRVHRGSNFKELCSIRKNVSEHVELRNETAKECKKRKTRKIY